jgi:nucleotide-binding universal stress UspA family protein
MKTLVPVDGSQSSLEAAKYAARIRPHDELILLYVAPSARQGDLERGRFVLGEFLRQCRVVAEAVRIETRLEVGDPQARLPQVAEDAGADLVVIGAHGVNALPQIEEVSPEASVLTEEVRRPVVLVTPTGRDIHPSPRRSRAPARNRASAEELTCVR